jgi:carbamoyl-phosphate synthase large subunit
MNILITSIGTATSINLFKLLHAYNFRIIGTDINKFGMTSGSLLVDKFYQVPPYYDKLYIDIFNEIIKTENIDLLIPINDYEIKIIKESNKLLPIKILAPSIDIIKFYSDKLNASIELEYFGIDTGRIINKSNYNNFDKIIYRKKQSVGSVGIQIFDTEKTDKNIFRDNYANEDYFIQEYINGEEYTVDVVSDKLGVPFIIIPRKRIEVKAGVATKVEIIKDKKLIESSELILKEMPVPGFCNIQFIKRNDVYYFIELNYRYGGMSIASALASYNYSKDLVDNYVYDKVTPLFSEIYPNIKWGAVITRYFEETLYYEE